MTSTRLEYLDISDIEVSPVALRTVQSDTEQFMELVESIKTKGVLCPVVVREEYDEATEENKLILVDGLQRYSASKEAGKQTIPANITDIKAKEVLEHQIVANLIKIDTKPVEVSKALKQMMQNDPMMTVPELAEKISKSTTYVNQRLSLLKLDEEIQKYVDEGRMPVANAFALSKMPRENQMEWLDKAMSEEASEFVPACNEQVKELRAAAREGRAAVKKEFEPKPRLRKLSELKSEMDSPSVAESLGSGAASKVAAFTAAIKWVLHMDDDSVQEAKASWEANEKARQEEKARKKAIRDSEKAAEAAAKAEEAREAAGLSPEDIEASMQQETADVVAE